MRDVEDALSVLDELSDEQRRAAMEFLRHMEKEEGAA